TDVTVKTSMMEARFLAGSADLFQEFHRKYWRKIVSKNSDLYLDQKLEERRREYQKFGETVYLLEPNVKKKQGRSAGSPSAAMGGHGSFSSADYPGAFRPRYSVARGFAGADRGTGIPMARACAPPCPRGSPPRDSHVRRAGLARAALRLSRSTAFARGRAVHAAVLPAHDGIARALHAVRG